MEFQTYIFTHKGQAFTAKELTSISLQETLQLLNGQEINKRQGSRMTYLSYVDEDGENVELRNVGFYFNADSCYIRVDNFQTMFGVISDKIKSFLGFREMKAPVLTGQEWLDFLFLELPNGIGWTEGILRKILNYQSNYIFNNWQDKFFDGKYITPVYLFDKATLQYRQPVFFDVVVSGDTATINVTDSTGALQYSLDGEVWQDSNIFAGLADGQHTIYAKDDNSTSGKSISISTDI